ncbi:integrase, catalytic region, zinc finger, CCHC-type containing protein [Tanacetum coccineum]
MQGTSLTKQERECKLHDAFDKFTHIKGESLHQYYWRFTQLMNDMNIYNMKLEQFHVNTKFLKSLPPEWSKFMTNVKLVQDLHTTKFDQLHAYLEQQKLHANESTCSTTSREINSYAAGNLGTRANTLGIRGNYLGQQRVVKCFNCQREGHMARQCPKPKWKRDATWFREKVLFVEAQGTGKVLNEEELKFLADPGIVEGPVTQSVITHNVTFQEDDLDAYDSNCDEISTAKAVLMANLSSYGSDVLSEVPISDNTNNDMLNQIVPKMPYSEPYHFVEHPENEIHNVQDTNSSAQQDALILTVFEQLSNQVTNCNKVNNDNLIANKSLSVELKRYKERVKFLEERQNVDLSTREKLIIGDIIREKNAQFTDFEKEINNLKQTLSEQSKEKELLTKTFNVFKNKSNEKEAKNIDTEISLEKKVFYDNNLKQALGFQNPFYLKKAQKIRPMLYDGNVIAKETNVISIADSEESLMLEEESQSKMLSKQSDPLVLEKKVNTKLIDYAELNQLSEDFGKRFIPQRELSDEQALHPIIDQSASSPVKIEAPQELPKMEAAVQQYHVDKQYSNTFVNVNSFVAMIESVNYVEMCYKCLELKAELIKQHNMVEKDEFNRLSKRFSELEQHCISLEIAMQINKEIFQKNDTSANQTEPSFDQLFKLNNLKSELQAKYTTIEKLKTHIKQVNETSTSESVKKYFDKIKTINIELEHRVTKLIAKNEHLKQTYKQLFDSIKPSRVRAKEQTESLVNQVNQKKLKEKEITDNTAQMTNAIAPGMYKLDPVILAPKVKNNREAHEYYLKHTMEQVAILREVVEQAKSRNPLDSVSYSAYMYVKLIQEFLGYVRDTCPDIHKPSKKLVAVIQIVLWYLDSGCSKHMTEDRSQLTNFVHKFLGTVKFDNDQVEKIMGYGDYQIENVTISRVYYMEGLGHNIFSVSQFWICASSPIVSCQATKINVIGYGIMSISSLNFGVINHLARHGLVRGLPRLKFEKDHFCSACAMGKSKKQSHKPKSEDTNQEKLYLLHMDLCGPMRVASVNGKKYILVIVDDYSRFTWVSFSNQRRASSSVESIGYVPRQLLFQVAPSAKVTSQTTPQIQSQTISLCAKEESRMILMVANMSNEILILAINSEPVFEESSSWMYLYYYGCKGGYFEWYFAREEVLRSTGWYEFICYRFDIPRDSPKARLIPIVYQRKSKYPPGTKLSQPMFQHSRSKAYRHLISLYKREGRMDSSSFTLSERNISWRTSLPRLYVEKELNSLSTSWDDESFVILDETLKELAEKRRIVGWFLFRISLV